MGLCLYMYFINKKQLFIERHFVIFGGVLPYELYINMKVSLSWEDCCFGVKIKWVGKNICLYFNKKDKNIISQFFRIGKDCDWIGNRLSKNDEKFPYLH